MARFGVDFEQVCTVARKLAADGKNPTVDGVRSALGGTGSKSTIAPLLKRWKEQNVAPAAAAEIGLPLDLAQAVKRLHEEMQSVFSERLKSEQEIWTGRIGELTASIADLETKLAATQAESGHVARELTEAVAALDIANTSLATDCTALRELESANVRLEQRLAERSGEVVRLSHELAQSHKQFDHFQHATQTRWEQERRSTERREAESEKIVRSLRDQLQKSQSSALLSQGKLERLDADHSQLQSASEILKQDCARLQARTEQLNANLDRCSEARSELERINNEAAMRSRELETALAIARSETSLIKSQLNSTEQQLKEVAAERLVLVKELTTAQVELQRVNDTLNDVKRV